MTADEHYKRAEQLLAEGVKVVEKIKSAPDDYHPYANSGGLTQEMWVTKRRDELGKQVMGIWAQAQVHATLASGITSVST